MKEDELEAKRWLRALRKDAKLSQAALAEIVGVERRTIVNAESEREDTSFPQGFTLLKILRELGAVQDAPSAAQSPLARLEEKADEMLGGIGDILDLLRESPDESDADAPAGFPP